ncbi:MAG: DNA-protecting protein DprA [Gammaproteobacteria bacterium]|nr:DNA-protecting protein DprA [Gammaproteobacteria bacterium]
MNDRAPESQILREWLAVLSAPGIGPVNFARLLEQIVDPDRLLAGVLNYAALPEATRAYLRTADWPTIDQDLLWAEQDGNHILRLNSADYPSLLREIPDPPPLLYVHGHIEALHTPQLAMVGSRNPSAGGQETARTFAAQLGGVGLTITSGLALGIDAASHAGALDNNGDSNGTTIAVMGTGLDRVYPARHRDLAHDIVSRGGALVAEFPIGTGPRPENFPRRNRIISGLSLGTLVVEAAPRSGSLTTARHAVEQGREVFAIPGSIHNPLARGCHALIRQGAKLVETAEDILEELREALGVYTERRVQISTPWPSSPETLTPDQTQLLDYMGFDIVSIDQLVARSGLTAAAVSSMLLILELDGRVISQAGGRYVRNETRG